MNTKTVKIPRMTREEIYQSVRMSSEEIDQIHTSLKPLEITGMEAAVMGWDTLEGALTNMEAQAARYRKQLLAGEKIDNFGGFNLIIKLASSYREQIEANKSLYNTER